MRATAITITIVKMMANVAAIESNGNSNGNGGIARAMARMREVVIGKTIVNGMTSARETPGDGNDNCEDDLRRRC